MNKVMAAMVVFFTLSLTASANGGPAAAVGFIANTRRIPNLRRPPRNVFIPATPVFAAPRHTNFFVPSVQPQRFAAPAYFAPQTFCAPRAVYVPPVAAFVPAQRAYAPRTAFAAPRAVYDPATFFVPAQRAYLSNGCDCLDDGQSPQIDPDLLRRALRAANNNCR